MENVAADFDLNLWIVRTKLLSPSEKGIYIDLMVHSLRAKDKGSSVTTDDLERMKRGFTDYELDAFEYVLNTFFEVKDGKLINVNG